MKRGCALALALVATMAQAEGGYGDMDELQRMLNYGLAGLWSLAIPFLCIAVGRHTPKLRWVLRLVLIDAAALLGLAAFIWWGDQDYLATPWPWLALNLPGLVLAGKYLKAGRQRS